MKKKKKNKKSEDIDVYDDYDQDSDENFYYIAGYTSGGAPFGITWEEAIDDGSVESNSITDKRQVKETI